MHSLKMIAGLLPSCKKKRLSVFYIANDGVVVKLKELTSVITLI